ncbi:MAG TPA: hypothetical protein VFK05_12740 [Polyangiaceae bacterium]|nr:hypothetical protein [Polyangiaceae bacterium]
MPLPVDALSYEGSITNASIVGLPTPSSLVEGTPATVVDSHTAPGSLSRLPNAADSDDAALDWSFTPTPTPGAPNAL